MTVIVLSFRAPATLVAAVRSLLNQTPVPEVIVVNSGGGHAARLLELTHIHVPVFEIAERMLPGAARNVGIRHARGSCIAFLADDCEAAEGWVGCRLTQHRAGRVGVASALISDRPSNVFATASHIGLFGRRMPKCPADLAQAYGVSFKRDVFDRYGLFREDLRAGEDTDFIQRLSADERPQWVPEIVTVHRSPATFSAFLADQFIRGGRSARVWMGLIGKRPVSVAWAAIVRVVETIRLASVVIEDSQRMRLPLVSILIAMGGIAYAVGALWTYRRHEGRQD